MVSIVIMIKEKNNSRFVAYSLILIMCGLVGQINFANAQNKVRVPELVVDSSNSYYPINNGQVINADKVIIKDSTLSFLRGRQSTVGEILIDGGTFGLYILHHMGNIANTADAIGHEVTKSLSGQELQEYQDLVQQFMNETKQNKFTYLKGDRTAFNDLRDHFVGTFGGAQGRLIVERDVNLKNYGDFLFAADVDIHGQLNIDSTSYMLIARASEGNVNTYGQGSLNLFNGGNIYGQLKISPMRGFEQDGSAILNLEGGDLNFFTDQKYIGDTNINDGTLYLHSAQLSDSKITINQNGALVAKANSTADHIVNNGKLYIGNAQNNQEIFGTLIIAKNYEGLQGSQIYMGEIAQVDPVIEVNDPSNNHHKNLLIITGDAKGESEVVIGKINELNKHYITEKGILLVQVDGQSSLVLTSSRITSGGTEYLLNGYVDQNSLTKGNNSWYLGNTQFVPLTTPGTNVIKQTIYAPEAGAYLANHMIANQIFDHQYHDRNYVIGYDGVWMNVKASFGKFQTNLGSSLDSKTNTYSMYLGKDFLKDEHVNAGAMLAYGYSDGNSNNKLTGFKADHNSQGFALGAYGTYNFKEHSYIDAWVQYVYMRNEVKGQNLANEKYNSDGFLASIEIAHAFDLGETIKLQPQLQVTYMGVKADTHKDASGTTITSNTGNVQTRVGLRLFANKALLNGQLTPYIAMNYYHNSKPFSTKLSDDLGNITNITINGMKNVYQVEVGMKTEVESHWTVGGSIGYIQGKNKLRDTSIQLEVRYEF